LSLVVDLEECPKWTALKEALEEIDEDHRSALAADPADLEGRPVRVLVAAEDDQTCAQLREVGVGGGGGKEGGPVRVLVAAEDDQTCAQLKEV